MLLYIVSKKSRIYLRNFHWSRIIIIRSINNNYAKRFHETLTRKVNSKNYFLVG